MDNNRTLIIGFTILVWSCFFALGFVFGFASGGVNSDHRWKLESVKQNKAEWVTDENGEPTWQWKEQEPQP